MAGMKTLQQCGNFQLIAELAWPGVGEWYLARRAGQPDDGQRVVVRLFTTAALAQLQTVEPLLEQATDAGSINHPDLVKVLEVADCDRGPYIATEHVAGISVDELLRLLKALHQPLPLRIAVNIVRHVALALDATHHAVDESNESIAMVHGAIAPAHVLVTIDGSVKVAGLGTAYAENWLVGVAQQDLSALVSRLAPEQVRGESPVAASDQFSLGALFWELVAQRPLFAGVDIAAVGHAVQSEPIAALAELVPETPPAISAVVARMLDRDPVRRFDRCSRAADALAGFLRETGGSARNEIALLVQQLAGARIGALLAAPAVDGARAAADTAPPELPLQNLQPVTEPPPLLSIDDLQSVTEPPPLLSIDDLQPVTAPAAIDIGLSGAPATIDIGLSGTPATIDIGLAGAPAAFTYCMTCGAEQPANAKFCSECGTSFSGDAAAAAAPEPVVDRIVTHTSRANQAVACHACGVVLDDDVRYCRRCGAPVVDDGAKSAVHAAPTETRPVAAAAAQRAVGAGQSVIEIAHGAREDAGIEVVGEDERPDRDYLESTFVGRAAELEALRAALEQARAGLTQRRLIAGAPGTGKTRLLNEAAALATGREFRVVQATAARFGVPVALDLFRQWVIGLCDQLGARPHSAEELYASSVADACGWISRMTLPAPLKDRLVQLFDGTLSEGFTDSTIHRQRMESALLCFLWLVAQERPICLLADSLHHADTASLALLGELTARMPESRLALIAASGPELPGRPFAANEVIVLGPLGDLDIHGLANSLLAQGSLPGDLDRALRAGCHGNPLLAADHMRSLMHSKLLQFDGSGWLLMDTDDSLRVKLAKETSDTQKARLSAAAQRAIVVAALAGEVVSTSLVTAACALPEKAGLAAVSEAMTIGLIASRGRSLAVGHFRQSTVRACLLLGLDAEVVSKVQVALARLYQQRARLPAALAAELSVRYLRAGGALSDFSDPVVDLAHMLLQQGALVDARELFESALRAGMAQLSSTARASVEDVAQLYRLGAAMTSIMIAVHPGRAAALLAPLLQALPPQLAPQARAEALRRRAQAYMACQQPHDAAAALDLAVRGLPPDASPALVAVLKSERALALDAGGSHAKALDLYRLALQVLTEAPLLPDERPDERNDNTGVTCLRLGRLHEREKQTDLAQQMYSRAASIAPLRRVEAMLAQASLALAAGDQTLADRSIAEARQQAEHLGDPWSMAQAYRALVQRDPAARDEKTRKYLRRAWRYALMSGQSTIAAEMQAAIDALSAAPNALVT